MVKVAGADDPRTIEKSLQDLSALMAKIDGIPSGVTKKDLVKTCRTKKFDGKKIRLSIWDKDTEIAYEALIQDFNRRSLPNNKVCD